MKTGSIVALSILGIFVLIGFGTCSYIVGTNNTCIRQENSILTAWEEFQNIDGALENSLRAQGITVGNYSDTFIKSIQENVKRYANDQQLMFKMVQESAAIAPDSELWKKIQNSIEAGYTQWSQWQKSLRDKVRVYRDYIEPFPRSFVVQMLGFPKKEDVIMAMNTVIVAESTKQTFDTGVKKATDPFGK